jgi:hypothetical protein
MMGKEPSSFRGVQGTAVVGVMGWTIASVGASEKTLKRTGIPFLKIYTHSNQHAAYYPGARRRRAGEGHVESLAEPEREA